MAGMTDFIKQHQGQLYIAIGASIWGTQGPFAKFIMQSGGNPSFVSFSKLAVGSLLLFLILGFSHPDKLKIDHKGFWLTCFIGLFCQAGFNYTYYSAVGLIGIANAAVILYLSPLFFLMYSILFFSDCLTKRKSLSALLCVVGCTIAVTGGSLDLQALSLWGVFLGLLSAFSFATMGALGKKALVGYDAMTIMAYSFMWGALFMIPSSMMSGAFDIELNSNLITGVIGIGLFPAVLAYFFYFKGVEKGVQLSQAGVICSMEMVSAILIAFSLFNEHMGMVKWLGVGIILISILLSQEVKATA